MKKICSMLITGAAALLLAGCETDGLSVREQHNNYAGLINSAYRQPVSNAPAAPLAVPLRLAVAQIGEVAPDSALLTNLTRRPALVASVVALPMPGERTSLNRYEGSVADKPGDADRLSGQIQSLCNLSRYAGARYVLLVGGSMDTYSSHNFLTLFDATIVGGALLPAVQLSSDGKAAGALIDAETGRVLLLANAGVRDTASSPDYFSTDRQESLNNRVRAELLEKLAGNFLDQLASQTATNVPR